LLAREPLGPSHATAHRHLLSIHDELEVNIVESQDPPFSYCNACGSEDSKDLRKLLRISRIF